MMLRLEEPGEGIALLGVHPYASRTHASVRIFFYGGKAAALASQLEPRWRDWMARKFPSAP
jgi:hypothetical protein